MIKKQTKIDDITLTYYVLGKGRPVLFPHGGRIRALTHKNNLELLAKKYLVIAPDMPSHGDSDTPKKIWSFIDFANFFDKFLNELKLKNVTVIGYSFGGGVAFNLAAISKDVSKLILVNAAGQGSYGKSDFVINIQRLYFYLTSP